MSNKGFALLWSTVLILIVSMMSVAGLASDGTSLGCTDNGAQRGVAVAVDYILSCQNDDGGFGNGPGVASNQRETSEAVMALVLTDDLDRAVNNGNTPLVYLAANPPSDTLPNYAGTLGRYVTGVVAAGGNPYDLDGTDYVDLLKTAADEEGHNPNFFAEAYVPLGLAAAGDPDCPEAKDSIAYLKEKQGSGGNWVGVDATGLVVCAMIACGEDPASEPVQRAMTWIGDNQNDDGGFPADPGGVSNSNSENLAIMAICAVGDDPKTWVKNGATPIDHLLSCQQPDGRIWWLLKTKGSFPVQCTAVGSIALSEGWLPTATFEGPVANPGGVPVETLSIKAVSPPPGVALAVDYILSCQNDDGGFANEPGGESTRKWTADVATALVGTGNLDRATAGDVLGYLAATAPGVGETTPGNLGRYVMGIVAAGGDPYDVNGIDYVERLKNRDPLGQFFADSLILMGLAAAGEPGCTEAGDLVTTFLDGQGSEGGWSWAPGGSDVDTTGMVVSALVSAGVDPGSSSIQDAMGYLRDVHDDETGGFSMGTRMSPASNSNSCGLAIMAINAGGEDPADWVTSGGKNPIDFMLTCQQENGVIWWKPDAAGAFLVEGTAFGAIGMDGGWMPAAVFAL